MKEGYNVPLLGISKMTHYFGGLRAVHNYSLEIRPGQVRDDTDGVGAGEVIGVLERMVTFVLVAGGAFTAVGFVIAAKAAARFPLFKETAFAEYFLIGTLTSVGLALLLGLLVLSAL